jgi:hypothetical protein
VFKELYDSIRKNKILLEMENTISVSHKVCEGNDIGHFSWQDKAAK